MLLAFYSADIAFFITITHILDCFCAIKMLSAPLQVDYQIIIRILVIHILFNIDINAANSVNKTFEAFKINHDIVIDLNA